MALAQCRSKDTDRGGPRKVFLSLLFFFLFVLFCSVGVVAFIIFYLLFLIFIKNFFNMYIFFFFKKSISWLCWVFVAAHKLSLTVAGGGYSLLQCTGFAL